MEFEVLIAYMKSFTFWDITLCSLLKPEDISEEHAA
jgi:hypothetical protein